jgi:hypothetical protein
LFLASLRQKEWSSPMLAGEKSCRCVTAASTALGPSEHAFVASQFERSVVAAHESENAV